LTFHAFRRVLADQAGAHTQEGLQTLLPLLEQLPAVHEHQGVQATPGKHRSGRDRLAEGRRRAEHPGVVAQHRRDGRLLVEAQGACEGHIT
jgi:IS5 family transposase